MDMQFCEEVPYAVHKYPDCAASADHEAVPPPAMVLEWKISQARRNCADKGIESHTSAHSRV